MSSMITALLQVSDAYCEARKLSPGRVSTLVFGDGKVLKDLAAGERDITTRRYETALVWYSTNWPADAVWPEQVDRPAPAPEPEPEPTA